MRAIGEQTFVDKILGKEQPQTIVYKPNDFDPSKTYLVDKLFLKGVNIDRSLNETNLDYRQSRREEQKGIREFVHKYHLGLQPFYF